MNVRFPDRGTNPLKKVGLIAIGSLAGLGLSVFLFLALEHYTLMEKGEIIDNVYGAKGSIGLVSGGMYELDNEIGFKPTRNYTGTNINMPIRPHPTNSMGLVGSAEIDNNSNRKNILFLGDSIAYGVLVELKDTFIPMMQSLAGSQYQLVNASCSGWGTSQELLFYDKYLKDFKWDLVVLVFTTNDLERTVWKSIKLGDGKRIEALYYLDQGLWARFRLGLIRSGYLLHENTRSLSDQHNGMLIGWDPEQWSRFKKNVLGPLLIEKIKPKVVVVSVPNAHQLLAAMRNAPAADVFFPQIEMERFCRERGLKYMDLAPAMLAAPDPMALFLDEMHLNVAGHRQIYMPLWERLLEEFPKG